MTDEQQKFTPGPWNVRPEFSQDHGQFCIDGPDGHELAAVTAWLFEYRQEAKANAHLIAAAPAMFEALKVLADAVGRYQAVGPLKGVRVDLARGLDMALAALSSAEGREPNQ